MTQFTDRAGTRRRGHLQVVDDSFDPPTHQPWCDPAEHTGTSCRSTPVRMAFGYRGEHATAVPSAAMQLATVPAAAGEPSNTRARVTLGTDVFEFDVDQLVAIDAGLESLLLGLIGMTAQAAHLAEKAIRMAETKPYPAAAGV